MPVSSLPKIKTTKRFDLTVFAVILIVIFAQGIGQAMAIDPPNVIAYQGRILDSVGVPVSDGTADINFEIFDGPDSGADTCLWSNDSSTCNGGAGSVVAETITLTDGLFSESLGSVADGYSAIDDSLFADQATLYLAITINGEALTPLKQIVSQGFAINSSLLDGLDSSSVGGTSAFVPVTDSTGNLLLSGDPQGLGVSNGVLYINPAAAAAGETLFGISLNDDERFRVSAEGDISVDGVLTISGAGASAFSGNITSAGDLAVNGDDITSDGTLTIDSTGVIRLGVDDDFLPQLGAGSADIGSVAGRWDTIYGVAGNFSGTVTTGDMTCTDCLDFTELSDALTLDAATSIATAGFTLSTSGIGALAFNSTGQVTFGGNVDATSGLDVTNANLTVGGANFSVAVGSGDITSAGDLAVNGGDISTTGALNISSAGGTLTFDSTGVVRLGVDDDFLPQLGAGSADIGSVAGRWDTIYGVAGNFSGTVTTGDLACTNCLDFTELADALALDASTSITQSDAESLTITNGSTADTIINLTSTGDVVLQTSGTPFATFNNSGNVVFANNVTLGADATDTIALNGEIGTNIIPDLTATFNLGSGDKRWNSIYGSAGDFSGTVTAGDIACTNCLDFTEVSNALTLDAATSIATAGFDLSTSGIGTLSFNSTGQVTFAGNVDATSGLDVTNANLTVGGANFSVTVGSGNITSAGDLAVNGDDVTSDGTLTIDSSGVIRLGVDDDFLPQLGAGTADIGSVAGRWDTVYGVAGNFSGTVTTGDLACTDCLDFAELSDALALDASTSITQSDAEAFTITNNSTANTAVNLASTGDFILQTGGVTFATFDNSGNAQFENTVTLGSSAADSLMVNSVIGTNLIPDGGNLEIGSNVSRWGDVYLNESTSLHLGTEIGSEATLSYDGVLFSIVTDNETTFDTDVLTISGDLAVNGDDLTSDGTLTINSSGTVQLGTDDDFLPQLGAGSADIGSALVPWDNLYVTDASVTGTLTAGTLACTDCLNFTSFTDTLSLDAATSIDVGANNLTFSGSGSGDVLINTDSDTSVNIAGTAAPGADIVTISDGGSSTSTDLVDALSISFGALNTSNSLIRLSSDYSGDGGGNFFIIRANNMTASSSAGIDTVSGLSIGTMTEAGVGTVNSSAININTGWDKILDSSLDISTTGDLSDDSGDVTIADNVSITGTTISATAVTTLTCSDCINFDDVSDALSLDANTSISQGAFTWGQDYSGAVGNAFTYTTNSLTTGNALSISSSSGNLTSGNLGSIDHTATYTSTLTDSGNLLKLNRELTSSGAGVVLTVSDPILNISNNFITAGGGTISDDASSLISVSQDYASSNAELLTLINAGNGIALNIDSESTTSNTATFDGSVLTTGNILKLIGGNFTNDSGRALDIDVTESTETADIIKLQTDYSGANTDVFRVEADGETFSRLGFTAGTGGATTYADSSMTTSSASFTIDPFATGGIILGGKDDALRLEAADVTVEGSITDSPVITLRGNYDSTAGGLVVPSNDNATIQHNITAAGPVPTSQLEFNISEGSAEMIISESGDLTAIGGVAFGDASNADRFQFTSAVNNVDIMPMTFDSLTSSDAITMSVDALTTGSGLFIQRANNVGSDYLGSASDALAYIDQEDTGAGTGDTLRVTQKSSGTGSGIYLVQNTVGAPGADAIDNQAFVIDVNEAASTDSVMRIRAAASTIFNINNFGAITTDSGITAGGASTTGSSFSFTTNATTSTAMALAFDTVTTGTGLDISIDNLTTGSGLKLTRADSAENFTADTTEALLYVDQANNNGGTTGEAVRIHNMGKAGSTGLYLIQDTLDAPGTGSTSNQAMVIQTTEAGSNDDLVLMMSNGGGDTEFIFESDGDAFADGAFTGGGADLAETYQSQEVLVPGDVVSFDPSAPMYVKKSTGGYEELLAGVISTKPAFRMSGQGAGEPMLGYDVALVGRTPVHVSDENGSIVAGDPLTSSATREGYAMKATDSGNIVGFALESLNGSDGDILAFIRASYEGATSVASNTASETQSSTLSSLNVSGNVYLNGQSILSISSLSGISDNWSVQEDGTFVTSKTYTAEIATTQGGTTTVTAVMSPEVSITLSGTAELTNGEARIDFESINPSFNDSISPVASIRVLVTANGPTGALYVSDKDQNGFLVEESGGSSDGVSFDWMVIAYRNGYEPSEELIAPELEPEEATTTDTETVADTTTETSEEVAVEEIMIDEVMTEPTESETITEVDETPTETPDTTTEE